jgi:Family of unknown function (DUF6328)
MKLERQLKLALDESRLLILGSQVLYGFQFNGIFQQQFETLSFASRAVLCSGLPLLSLAIALLITPSMVHRIVERGETSRRVLTLATVCAGAALLPVAITLALDMFIAVGRATGAIFAAAAAAAFFTLAMSCWYVTAWLSKRKERAMGEEPDKPTPLETQVDQLLTEARVIIPGVQALLGFQLTVTLTQAFAGLPAGSKIAHIAALCCVGLAVILVMAPASVHRIAFSGQDHPDFLAIGSVFVVGAPLPLALGIALDAYVAAGRALSSQTAAFVLAVVSLVVLVGFWYVFPLWRRVRA